MKLARRLSLAIAALLFTGARGAHAQTAPAVFVTLVAHDSSVTAQPGTVATAWLPIMNRSVVRVSLVPRIVLPSGWTLAAGDRPLHISALEVERWSLGMRVPADATPGRYVVTYSVANVDGSPVGDDSLVVLVTPATQVAVATSQLSRRVRAAPVAAAMPSSSAQVGPPASPSTSALLAASTRTVPSAKSADSSAHAVSTSPSATANVVLASADAASPLAESLIADPGVTVTRAIRLTNSSSSRVAYAPSIEAPDGWSVPLGTASFSLGAGESDSWIVSLRVPARAPAGRYVVPVQAADANGRLLLRDSLMVEVSAKHGIELALTNRPTYAVSGESYVTTFTLHNRGNVPERVELHGTSAMGGSVSLPLTMVSLSAGESRTLSARVSASMKGVEARDDVFELRATAPGDTSISAVASSRVTIVQRAGSTEPLHRVASTLKLRAAQANTGVSPFELIGTGDLRDGGHEQLSYVFRGPTGRGSQFGDQEEYRVELKGTHYAARAGDALYRVSPLTSNGQMGFGGGLDVSQGAFTAGAFAQKFRFQPGDPTERGAYLSARSSDDAGAPQVTIAALDRSGGAFAGRVVSAGASMQANRNANVEVEVAESDGPNGRGLARTARVSGGTRLRYDVGHTMGDATFSGPMRGGEQDYASLALRPTDDWQLSATAGVNRSAGISLGLLAPQDYHSGTLRLEHGGDFSLQYSSLSRISHLSNGSDVDEMQRGLLARGERSLGVARLWGGAGAGVATNLSGDTHPYHELSAGLSANPGRSSITLYGETSRGMSVTRGVDAMMSYGGDARLQVLSGTSVLLDGFETVVLGGGQRIAQLDAGLAQQLPTGSTVSLRVRLSGNVLTEAGMRQVAYLEYSTPLGVPVGRSRTTGRVRGRVVDQESGHGVSGTLVRLGPQAAITDDEGRVSFAGLAAGEYRLTLAQQASQSTQVFRGDATIRVDSTKRVPTNFSVAVERAGAVSGSVRLMTVARTAVDASPDSLADGGPMDNITLALVGAHDTLYVVSDPSGVFRFGEIAGGARTLKVISDAPLGLRWEPAEIEVNVQPGATRTVNFRLVPRRRAVQMMNGDAKPVTLTAPPGRAQP